MQAELLSRGLSTKYVKNILNGSLRAMIGQALDDKVISADPFPRRLKWPKWRPPGADPFTAEERHRILDWFEAERREQKLVHAYRDFMTAQGSRIIRHLMQPEGEAKPLFSDLYDATRNLLLEAKGSATREAIRMAIGQLADYRRFIEPRPRCAVLLPGRPRPDLEALLRTEGIAVVWQTVDGTFADNDGGTFT